MSIVVAAVALIADDVVLHDEGVERHLLRIDLLEAIDLCVETEHAGVGVDIGVDVERYERLACQGAFYAVFDVGGRYLDHDHSRFIRHTVHGECRRICAAVIEACQIHGHG